MPLQASIWESIYFFGLYITFISWNKITSLINNGENGINLGELLYKDDKTCRELYERIIKKGKCKKLALIAVSIKGNDKMMCALTYYPYLN